jgi:cytochrome c-type biogenesis protein CcmH/NrfF
MRALVLPIAAAALVALVALAIVSALRPAVPATRAEQAAQLATELRCPDCAGLSVAESTSASASAIRAEIAAQLSAGATPDQVREHFVERYGEWILLSPTSRLAWLLPVLVVLAGIAGLAAWLRRRGSPSPAPAVVAAADLQRVRDEVEALDA